MSFELIFSLKHIKNKLDFSRIVDTTPKEMYGYSPIPIFEGISRPSHYEMKQTRKKM